MFLLLVITGKLLSLQESQWLNTEHLLQATLHLTMKKKNLPGVYVSGLIIQDKICARWIYLGYLIKYQIQREVGYFIERESISGGKKRCASCYMGQVQPEQKRLSPTNMGTTARGPSDEWDPVSLTIDWYKVWTRVELPSKGTASILENVQLS